MHGPNAAEVDSASIVLDDVVRSAIESRADIEQAKGILMMVYGITADRAFELLKWRSQDTNTRLRKLATQIVVDFTDTEMPVGFRAHADHLLLTAHRRIPTEEGDADE